MLTDYIFCFLLICYGYYKNAVKNNQRSLCSLLQIVILVVIQPATLSSTTNLEEKVVSRTKIL